MGTGSCRSETGELLSLSHPTKGQVQAQTPARGLPLWPSLPHPPGVGKSVNRPDILPEESVGGNPLEQEQGYEIGG